MSKSGDEQKKRNIIIKEAYFRGYIAGVSDGRRKQILTKHVRLSYTRDKAEIKACIRERLEQLTKEREG